MLLNLQCVSQSLFSDLSTFYRFYHYYCSQKNTDMTQGDPRSPETCTLYSSNGHLFQVSLPNLGTLSHKSSLLHRSFKLWNNLRSPIFPDPYNLSLFKTKINKLGLRCLPPPPQLYLLIIFLVFLVRDLL